MSKVLVGRDVTAFVVQSGGIDTATGGINAGATIDFLGTWKSVSIKVQNEWSDVTPSSARWREKRRTVKDLKATLNGFVRAGGSSALDLALGGDYVYLSFTDCQSGRAMTLVGGISEASYDKDRDKSEEGLEIEGVGLYGGGEPISYA